MLKKCVVAFSQPRRLFFPLPTEHEENQNWPAASQNQAIVRHY
jgi:hypothetical protein